MAGLIEIGLVARPSQQLQKLPTVVQPAPGTSDADFGGDIGRALSGAGAALGDATLEEAAQRNEAVARGIDNSFSGELRSLLHDPERGYHAMKGRAAVDAHTPTYQTITALYDKHVAMAANPAQQQMVRAVLDRRVRLAADGIAAHATREDAAWQDQTRGARIDGAIADATLAWRDPAQLRLHYNTGLQEVLARSGAEADPVRSGEARRGYATTFHAAIIGARIDADPDGARQYFEQNRTAMEPGAAAALEARLTLASKRRLALDIAERTAPRDTDPVLFGPGREPRRDDYVNGARAEAAALPDASPSLVVMAEGAAAKRHARDHAAWKARRGEAINAAYEWADANPDASVAEMPMQVWSDLDTETQARVERYVNAGGEIETDWRRYYELQDLAIERPDDFVAIDLVEEKPDIAERDLDLLEILQQILRKGDPDNERLHLRTAKEMVETVALANGIKSDDPAALTLRHRILDEFSGFGNENRNRVAADSVERAFRRFTSLQQESQSPRALVTPNRTALSSGASSTGPSSSGDNGGAADRVPDEPRDERAYLAASELLNSLELTGVDTDNRQIPLGLEQLSAVTLARQTFDTSPPPHFTPVSNDIFHDLVVKDLVKVLRNGGAVVVEEIRVRTISTDKSAVPDIFVKGRNGSRYVIEVKTRGNHHLNEAQSYVFPLIELGDHVYTTDPRIRELGLEPEQPLPAMCVYIAYAPKPDAKILVFSLSGDPKCVQGLK